MGFMQLPFLRKREGPRRRSQSAFLRSLQSPFLFAWNPALREGGWRAFVPSADNDIDEVITALDRNHRAVRRDLAGRQIHRRARSSG